MTGQELAGVLVGRARYRHTQDELRLQEEIAAVLDGAGVAYEREVVLSPTDRIDFLIGSLGLEVKVKGSRGAVLRQLSRYAEQERIVELVLFTTRSQIVVPPDIGGKSLERILYRTL